MKVLNILNLGAGVGSTTVYMLSHHGELPPFDAAILADTGEEPEPVYRHLQWLLTLNNPRILTTTIGKLGEHLLAGTVHAGQQRKGGRFASIPAFTATDHEDRDRPITAEEIGRQMRQCTKEYKVEPIEQTIRRELLGLKKRQRIPKDVMVRQHFGLSDDEGGRIESVKKAFRKNKRGEPVFPLATLGMTRSDCVAYLEKTVPHEVPRSACTFCPYRDNRGWLWLKENDPAGWQRAIEIDRTIRDPQALSYKGLRQSLYLHRQCIPLDQVDIEGEAAKERKKANTGQKDLFGLYDMGSCMAGMCGV